IRRVVRQRPEWGALLIDLRQHGESQGFAGPHTIQAAAADLDRLAENIDLRPHAVLGHSFGGKVALVHAGLTDTPPRQVWVIDSTPQEREPDGSAWDMLKLLEALPRRFESRDELISAMMERGQPKPLAQWMATNLVADAASSDAARSDAVTSSDATASDADTSSDADTGAYRWRLEFDAMRDLLVSFFETDAWDVVESPPDGTEVHLVKAEDSRILSGAALERAEAAAEG